MVDVFELVFLCFFFFDWHEHFLVVLCVNYLLGYYGVLCFLRVSSSRLIAMVMMAMINTAAIIHVLSSSVWFVPGVPSGVADGEVDVVGVGCVCVGFGLVA